MHNPTGVPRPERVDPRGWKPAPLRRSSPAKTEKATAIDTARGIDIDMGAWRERGRQEQPMRLRQLIWGSSAVLVMIGLFAGLAAMVTRDPGPSAVDLAAATYLKHLREQTPALVPIFTTITDLGDRTVLLSLGLGVCLYLGIRRQWLLLAAWVAVQASGGALSSFLKNGF
jgi:hypothetical protein